MAGLHAVDSSVVLAILHEEDDWQSYAGRISGQYIASINAAEVLTTLVQAGLTPEAAGQALRLLGMIVVPFDEQDAVMMAAMQPQMKGLRLGLGGKACLAFARRRDLIVLSADKAWRGLDLGVKIEVVR